MSTLIPGPDATIIALDDAEAKPQLLAAFAVGGATELVP